MPRHRNAPPERNRPHSQPGRSPANRPSSDRPRGEPPRRGGGDRRHLEPGRPQARPAEPGTAWLYGRHAVLAAVANPFREILRLLATDDAASRSEGELRKAQDQRGSAVVPLESVNRPELDALLPRGAVHQGIAVLVAALPEPDLQVILPEAPEAALVVVLDQVTDPHNVGAVMRSAAAFGAAAVIVTERNAPEETGVLAKSASGALEKVPLLRVVNLARTLDELKQEGFWIVGLAGEASQTMAQAKLSGRIVLVLGAEGDGLRRLTREHCDLLVRLPMSDKMPSLNVSNAAAVALYELARA